MKTILETRLLSKSLPEVAHLELVESGRWLGDMSLGYLTFHVDVIRIPRTARYDKNQQMLDWANRNPDCEPKLLEAGGRRYFVHVEVYSR